MVCKTGKNTVRKFNITFYRNIENKDYLIVTFYIR